MKTIQMRVNTLIGHILCYKGLLITIIEDRTEGNNFSRLAKQTVNLPGHKRFVVQYLWQTEAFGHWQFHMKNQYIKPNRPIDCELGKNRYCTCFIILFSLKG